MHGNEKTLYHIIRVSSSPKCTLLRIMQPEKDITQSGTDKKSTIFVSTRWKTVAQQTLSIAHFQLFIYLEKYFALTFFKVPRRN